MQNPENKRACRWVVMRHDLWSEREDRSSGYGQHAFEDGLHTSRVLVHPASVGIDGSLRRTGSKKL